MSNDQGMKPRLLLVEDDAISRNFMAAALQALPAQVEVASCTASALALHAHHDLWLLDANLPDGSGIDLLGKLQARQPGVPALAHTADDSATLHAQLLAAGFAGVVLKPMTAAHLLHVVGKQLKGAAGQCQGTLQSHPSFFDLPLWDPAVALAALNGNQAHVATLRGMFLDELGRQQQQVASALRCANVESARQVLHQLKASSGFVGALRLQAATTALENALADPSTLERFMSIAAQTSASAGP